MNAHRFWGLAGVLLVIGVSLVAPPGAVAGGKKPVELTEWPTDSYYKDFPQFHWYPEEDSTKPQSVYRFGPVGIGIDLTLPAFGMKVKNVEPGSPAEATGKLKPGQMIVSINGQTLKDIDPRVILGNIITQVEATDGKVRFMIKAQSDAKAEEVLVQIPVLGAYSKTWPLNCPKSDKIVRGEADYLAKFGDPQGYVSVNQGLLFLLSTGEPKDLEVVRSWVRKIVASNSDIDVAGPSANWNIGYGAPALCEYYLRTGDQSVLPYIEKTAAVVARTMYNGGWHHKDGINFKYGHLNAAGLHVMKFLMLAKECGVQVDEATLQESLKHFFRFAGRGNVAYGDGLPEQGFVDNGKMGGLAFAMAAAASLAPEGEQSVYARARDMAASKSFYTTSLMLHGHSGGGIGEVWRSSAMALIYDKKPNKCREFLDNRTWHYDLSRRYNGALTVLRDKDYSVKYDNENWGAAYALTYTVPRKTLRMTGAPPTKYSKTYSLPQRPWGTAADDVFYSLAPAPDKNGKVQDVDAEKLQTDASAPILRRLNNPKVTDEVLLMYARHPEYGVRQSAALAIREQGRYHLILQLLNDKDPRVRQAGAMVICVDSFQITFMPAGKLTGDMVAGLVKMITDPAESWWGVANAMAALSLAKPEQIAPQVDTLLGWTKHDEWWLQRAAVKALTPLATNPQYCQKIIPALADVAAKNRRSTLMWTMAGVVSSLSKAPPEVQKIALASFSHAYETFPTKLKTPGGADLQNVATFLQRFLAEAVVTFPNGFDELYRVSKKIMPDEALPYQTLYFNADASKFGPELVKVLPAVVVGDVVPEYIGENLNALLDESSWKPVQKKGGQFAIGALDGLVDLYDKGGIHDYGWHSFGPERDKIKWDYTSYAWPALVNAKDGKAKPDSRNLLANADRAQWDAAKAEAEVTQAKKGTEAAAAEKAKAARTRANQAMLAGMLPPDMATWYAPNFDVKNAGWKSGFAPFANVNGKLAPAWNKCTQKFCGCYEKPNSLWEKDVLLMRTTLDVPPLKKECRYRFLLGGNIHGSCGDAVTVYLNGKPVHQQEGFAAGRFYGKPRGFLIDLDMAKAFEKGKVLIEIAAVKPEPAYLSAWMEEMKMPPLGEHEIAKALARAPMKCAEWQELQDPEVKAKESELNEGKYRYNGKFKDDPQLHGDWTVIGQVNSMEEFSTGKAGNPGQPPFKTISLRADGKTGDNHWIWSGNILLALERKEALTMTLKTVEGKKYLFVESGGFSEENAKGWQSPLYVMAKTK